MKKLYAFFLKLYPARFREEFAAPLERQFSDEYREVEGAGERARFGLRTLVDLAVTIPAELAREARQDLAYAVRVYRRRSLSTILALAALALAIGATTGVFSVVNALLIRSLPFRQPDRLVRAMGMPVSPLQGRAAFESWPASHGHFASVASYFPMDVNLGLGNQATRVTMAEVSANFFAVLGSQATMGRTFAPDEELEGRDGVAVIGHAFWQQFFGGNPNVLGATIYLNGTPATVVGVAPASLDFPSKTTVWTPTIYDYQHLPKSGVFFGTTVGRLKSGWTVARASAAYRAEVLRERKTPLLKGMEQPELISLQDQLAGPVRQASFVLMGLVIFVLLIACANVAHLLLARTAERRQELMIRNALGASRARLVQQLITESLFLTLLAAGSGLAVARWAARVAASAQPAQLAVQRYTVLDWRVLAFAIALAGLTGVIFGVLPAWLLGRMQAAHDGVRSRTSQSSGARRMRIALLAMQGAFTLVLIAGSVTMGRSFLRLLGANLGYQTDHLVTLNVSLSGTPWATDNHQVLYYDDALARLRAIAGVESAAAVAYLPLMDHFYGGGAVELDDRHKVSPTIWNNVSPDYFRAMRTRILEGRDFSDGDRQGSDPVAIVTEQFATQLGVGPHVVGKRVSVRYSATIVRTYTIVGVVETPLARGPAAGSYVQMFRPIAQAAPDFATFVAHVRGAPETYLAMCRDTVQAVDRRVPVYDVRTLDDRLRDNLARPRFYTTAVLFFGGFALLLAIVGIYGVATYSIAQRTQEIGVRIAVGASATSVRSMLLWQSLLPLSCGVLAGIGGAVLSGRYLEHLITHVDATGIGTCAAAAALLALTAALAVWTATGRIVRMDPTAALRAE